MIYCQILSTNSSYENVTMENSLEKQYCYLWSLRYFSQARKLALTAQESKTPKRAFDKIKECLTMNLKMRLQNCNSEVWPLKVLFDNLKKKLVLDLCLLRRSSWGIWFFWRCVLNQNIRVDFLGIQACLQDTVRGL